MTMIYFDGFDQYANGAEAENEGGWYIPQSNFTISANGRNGGKSFESVSNSDAVRTVSDQSGNTLVLGAAFKITKGYTDNDGALFSLYKLRASGTGDIQTQVRLQANRTLRITRGIDTTIATGTVPLLDNAWYYVEWKILVANSGTTQLRINNVIDIATFNGDTQNESTDNVVTYSIGNSSYGVEMLVDDFYILNTLGSLNNDYLGDVSCKILTPNGDNTVAWTKSAGPNNYLLIDDDYGNPDDDTTYVHSSVSTTKDSYDLPAMPGATSVEAIKIMARASKTDLGFINLEYGITTGANPQFFTQPIGEEYAPYIHIYEDQDGASTLWTESAVNAAVLTIEVA